MKYFDFGTDHPTVCTIFKVLNGIVRGRLSNAAIAKIIKSI
ncbi:MAG TPA: hypothetical protein VM935_10515 [Chitinophagaceae bacterium]|nr:hypothetical protein [Chitinophagaceae bacterium]